MFTTFFATCRGLEDVLVWLGAYSLLVTLALVFAVGKSAGRRNI